MRLVVGTRRKTNQYIPKTPLRGLLLFCETNLIHIGLGFTHLFHSIPCVLNL